MPFPPALTNGPFLDDTPSAAFHGPVLHREAYDALVAILAELGAGPKGAAVDVTARLATLDTTVAGKATPGDVTAAVAALVASAPGALDTLDELAAALGDDASFAATVTASLAGKVPLSLVDAADDLLVGTAADTLGRLAVPASRIIGKGAAGALAALTAADVLTLLNLHLPLFARKTADETLNNVAVLQNDDHLLLALVANASYRFEAVVFADGPGGGDIQYAFTVPAGATLKWSQLGPITTLSTPASTGSVNGVVTASGTANQVVGTMAGAVTSARLFGIVHTAGTAGNLQLQWAQAVATVGATTIYTDSWLRADRVA